MISQDRLEKALKFLAETDEPCAELRANMERTEYQAKAIKDAVFARLDGTVAERQAQAGIAPEYNRTMMLYFDLLKLYEAMKNKRATECIVVDTWRSLNSSRNKGILT